MTFHDRLEAETAAEKQAFIAIPLIQNTISDGTTRETYLAFLAQAFHHVKHTCRLLGLAASRCGEADYAYQKALFDYIDEEKGHEFWILDDIKAMGGDAEAVRSGEPGIPCSVMVGYAYYAIEHVSPYCLLGMVHVLEGMSVLLAQNAAEAIGKSLGLSDGQAGFSYLVSHGALDQAHVAYFRDLVQTIKDPQHQDAIVRTSKVMYRLYGDIFRSLH